MILVLDCETTWTVIDKKRNPSPFLPTNKLVSVGCLAFSNDDSRRPLGQRYYFFNHKDGVPESADNHAKLQKLLDQTTLLVGHNVKFDLEWLRECGFTYDGKLYDTMIAEYMLARGAKIELSLDAMAKRLGVDNKKIDLIQPYYDKGMSFWEIPKAVTETYGLGDCKSTWGVFLNQSKRYNDPSSSGMVKIRDHMFEFCDVLTDMERNGICIDLGALNELEIQYKAEHDTINRRLLEIAAAVWGDAPLSFSSPEQLSQFVYGIKVTDKAAWAKAFGLGQVSRGSVSKRARPRLRSGTLDLVIKTLTTPVRRTTQRQCESCGGTRRVLQILRGKTTKRQVSCKTCEGTGVEYIESSVSGSLGLRHLAKEENATAGGFKTDKNLIADARLHLDPKRDAQALEFLELMTRLNQIETYLATFIGGIKRNVGADRILHPTFMQCVTATGRLSGRDPNFQNQPRGATFPIKRCFVSRWKGGHILEVDYRALEYRCAVSLGEDEAGRADILAGVDAHSLTDSYLGIGRQASKPHTFKPLYGGMSGTEKEVAYYEFFLKKHKGIAKWHKKLQDDAIRKGYITLPTGRQYSFPGAKRLPNGGSTFATQIKNYPVQGFATADIVPLACIALRRMLRKSSLKSLMINEVHDSILMDVYPGEEHQIAVMVREACLSVEQYLLDNWGYKMFVPLDIEIKIGKNNLDGKEWKHAT